MKLILRPYRVNYDPSSVVSIATGYGLDGPGIESLWGRDFPHLFRNASWGKHGLLCNGYWVFPRVKKRPKRDAEHSPILVPCSEKSKPILLFALWAVRPVQSFSACTGVHFTLLTW